MILNKHNIGLTPGEREFFEERAAIRQYDAGYKREEAERLARLDVMKLRKTEGDA